MSTDASFDHLPDGPSSDTALSGVPLSVRISNLAAQQCRKQGLFDIEVSVTEFNSVTLKLTRITQQAVDKLSTPGISPTRASLATQQYITDIVNFCRNVKFRSISLGLE